MRIGVDNRKVYRKLEEEIRKLSKYIQDTGAEIARIKIVLRNIKFKVTIELIRDHPKVTRPFT